MSSYREAALASSQNCSRSPGWPSHNPLRICRKPIRSEPPSCALKPHVKIIWFWICCITIPSHSLVSSRARSLVHVSPWLIFQYHLVNRKPIDKTWKHHLPPVAHFAQTTRVNLDAIPTRTAPMISPLHRVSAVRLLFQQFCALPVFGTTLRVVQYTGVQAALNHIAHMLPRGVAHVTVSPSIILLIPRRFLSSCHLIC